MQEWQKNLDFYTTVWKCQDFSVTQILREINFGEFWSYKAAVFAIFGVLKFANLVNFSLREVQKFLKIQIQSL